MTFIDYIKSRIYFICINLFLFIGLATLLLIVDFSLPYIGIVFSLWFLPLGTYMLLEFIRFKRLFSGLREAMNHLELKYLLCEVIEPPSFLEGKLFYELLQEAYKAMHEAVNKEHQIQRDYKEYIETWVHEIKTPIASMSLMMKNEDTPLARKLGYGIRRVEQYIEQVLYYARSSQVSQDYLIKPFNIKECVLEVIKNYRTDFIKKGIKLELEELDALVYSDKKWVSFILGQVLSNAIKYSQKEGANVIIGQEQQAHSLIIYIKDNGVGISEKDISRVFDKGFTGENGRSYGKSTGIGLYISKKLCEQLGLEIQLVSKKDKGTTVTITFPIEKYLKHLMQ